MSNSPTYTLVDAETGEELDGRPEELMFSDPELAQRTCEAMNGAAGERLFDIKTNPPEADR